MMTDVFEACCSVLTAAGFLLLIDGGISINCCVLNVLYKYSILIRGVRYYYACSWRQVICLVPQAMYILCQPSWFMYCTKECAEVRGSRLFRNAGNHL